MKQAIQHIIIGYVSIQIQSLVQCIFKVKKILKSEKWKMLRAHAHNKHHTVGIRWALGQFPNPTLFKSYSNQCIVWMHFLHCPWGLGQWHCCELESPHLTPFPIFVVWGKIPIFRCVVDICTVIFWSIVGPPLIIWQMSFFRNKPNKAKKNLIKEHVAI